MSPLNERKLYLDGLRGWLALIVLFFHIFIEILSGANDFFNNWVFKFLFDGPLAVFIFFLISGEALSSSFFERGDLKSVVKIALMRYPRFLFLIFLSSFFLYISKIFHFDYSEALQLKFSCPWVLKTNHTDLSLSSFLKFVFSDAFMDPNKNTFNPLLWSISLEFQGSFLVFLLCAFDKFLNSFAYVFLLVVSFLLHTMFFVILLGFLISKHRLLIESFFLSFKGKVFFGLCLCLAFLVSLFGYFFVFRNLGYVFVGIVYYIGFTVFVPDVFSKRLSLFLGKISFNIYIFQFWFLTTFFSFFTVQFFGYINNSIIGFLLLSFLSLFFFLLLCYVLEFLDSAYLRILKKSISLFLIK